MIYIVQCTCGGVTGYEFDPQLDTVECVKCGGLISTKDGKPLEEPPVVEDKEIDLLEVE